MYSASGRRGEGGYRVQGVRGDVLGGWGGRIKREQVLARIKGAILGRSETQECAYYNSSWEKERTNRSGIEPCYGDKDKRLHCFATWKNVSGNVEVVKQGCWLDDVNCYDSTECVEKKESPDVYFCCCEGSMCNEKFLYAPHGPPQSQTHQSTAYTTSNPFPPKPPIFSTLLYSLVPIVGLAAVVLFSFWMWRHHKLAYPAALVPTHVSTAADDTLRVYRDLGVASQLSFSPVHTDVQ
uniref:Activin types I and II receptor domain-containing protein n=1 Tax=Knipowitschia caucasica TaxID=637954 RepID=A0AAV2LDN9_KNICA